MYTYQSPPAISITVVIFTYLGLFLCYLYTHILFNNETSDTLVALGWITIARW
jgi:hypothetical protein